MKYTVFEGAALNEISFPVGGIGSGCIGVAGNGRLIDWEIFNRPNKRSLNGNTHFAIKAIKNGAVTDARIINGDVTTGLAGGSGLNSETMAGFPHFRNCVFTGEFPIASLDMTDDTFPGKIVMTAWNPLIPLNDKDSSIPAAFFEFSVTNTANEPLDFAVALCIRNPFEDSVNEYRKTGSGHELHLGQTRFSPDAVEYGELSAATDADDGVSYQEYWYRGSWNDGRERYWRNFTEQTAFENRSYPTPGTRDHGCLSVLKTIPAGETRHFRYVISWNVPNCRNYWNPYRVKQEDGTETDVTWKNYYAVLFESSSASAAYALAHWDRLWEGTKRYHDAMFGSSLPGEVIEAAASAVSVLKSPTVLRLENGEFYGWEGVWDNTGSCEGTCTHVWNYAYALCFLFPKLERSIRETDFRYNQDENGRMAFRMNLPLGRGIGGFRACVDGQMGGIIKTYRDWKLYGNDEWLKDLWPAVKKSLTYAWSEKNYDMWDLDRDGVLEGRQHHTLDMELFGPSSWLEGFYLCALKCAAEMADRVGDPDAAEYRALYEKGHAWTEENLFNGKWYAQKLDLTDKSYLEKFAGAVNTYWNEESQEIKYQIGEGCLLDQCLAQWHSAIIGTGMIFDKEHLHTALENVYRNNFLPDMRHHYNTFRLFAVNDESGAIICTFPKEIKRNPAIPIPYAQESMHGFEYAFAGLLLSEGMLDEGLAIVRSIRARYRGFNRNPYNEVECGFNYARSMASFSLLPILSGYRFDMSDGMLGFEPKYEGDFSCPWFTDAAWGCFERTGECTKLSVFSGTLPLKKLCLPYRKQVCRVTADGAEIPFVFDADNGMLSLDASVKNELVIA